MLWLLRLLDVQDNVILIARIRKRRLVYRRSHHLQRLILCLKTGVTRALEVRALSIMWRWIQGRWATLPLAYTFLGPAIILMQRPACFHMRASITVGGCLVTGTARFTFVPHALQPVRIGSQNHSSKTLFDGNAVREFQDSPTSSSAPDVQLCGNPNGITSSSPGLRGTSYPGWRAMGDQPRRGCVQHGGQGATPLGLCAWAWFPRVARSSQPWALRRNPFGIQHWNSRKALGLTP